MVDPNVPQGSDKVIPGESLLDYMARQNGTSPSTNPPSQLAQSQPTFPFPAQVPLAPQPAAQNQMVEVTLPDGQKVFVPISALSVVPSSVAPSVVPSAAPVPVIVASPQYAPLVQAPQSYQAPLQGGLQGNLVQPHSAYFLTTYFPKIKEHFKAEHLPISGVGLSVGKALGFDSGRSKGFTASLEDVVKTAIIDLKPLKPDRSYMFTDVSQIPNEHVNYVIEHLNPKLNAETYQNLMDKISLVDKGIEFAGKAELAMLGFEIRSFGKKEGGKPVASAYDRVMRLEQLFFGAEAGVVMYSLAKMHDEHESFMEGSWDAITNPYVDRLLAYLAGVHIGIPIVADIFKDGHPIETVSEKFDEYFHKKVSSLKGKSDSGNDSGLVNMLGNKYLTSSSSVAGKMTELYTEMKDDNKHPVIANLAAFMGEEGSLLSLAGATLIRGTHVAFMHFPFITEYAGRSIIYKESQDVARVAYGMGK